MKTGIKTNIGKWLVLAAAIGLIFWISRSFFRLDVNEIRTWILSFGLWAPVIYIAAYTIRPLVFFPASVLSITGGLAFGAWLGTLYTVIGAVFGAMLSYAAAKKLGTTFTNKKISGNALKIQEQMEHKGFFYVLLLRLTPGLSFDLISYIAGIVKVRFSAFVLATAIGIIPGTFALNFLGNSFTGENPKLVISAMIVFTLVACVPILIRNRWNKKRNDKEQDMAN